MKYFYLFRFIYILIENNRINMNSLIYGLFLKWMIRDVFVVK